MKKLKIIKNSISLLIGLIILLILFYKIGFETFFLTIKTIDLAYLPLILLLFFITLIFGTINIRLLLSPFKKFNFKTILKHFLISWSFGLVTPGRLGDVSITYLLKKEGLSFGKSFSAFIVDKIVSVSILFLFSCWALFKFFSFELAIRVTSISLILLIIVIFILFTKRGRKILRKGLLKKYAYVFEGFGVATDSFLKNNKSLLFVNAFITTIRFATTSILGYFVLLSLGVQVNLFFILLIFSVSQILSLIPLTLSGLGIREASNVFLYSQIGIDPSIALSKSIVELILNYLIGFLIVLTLGRDYLNKKIV